MKTLATLTAIAALTAGISIASAQGTMSPKSTTDAMGNHVKVSGNAQYCIKGSSGALNCTYASLAACQKAAKSGETCSDNPNRETTGSGSNMK